MVDISILGIISCTTETALAETVARALRGEPVEHAAWANPFSHGLLTHAAVGNMNAWLVWWLTTQRGWIGPAKNSPLWVIGVAMMVAYNRSGGHRFGVPLLLLIAPMVVKLAVAACVVGWRAAIVPPQNDTHWFLPSARAMRRIRRGR